MSHRAWLVISIAVGLALVGPAVASAHIFITLPDGRSDLTNLQEGPCGGIPRGAGAPATVYAPGQTIMVGWSETIDHPGTWRIAFSPAGDLGFDDNVLLEGDDHPGTGDYLEMVTLPTTPCEDCTLQVYQYMDPEFHPPPDYYYSCADIIIRAADTDAGPTLDAGAPGEDAGSTTRDAGTPRRDAGDTGGGLDDEGGCGCTVPGPRPLTSLPLTALLALAAVVALRTRRRR